MENGVVNLINGLPEEFARHCVVALTEVASSFARRIGRSDVRFVELRKPPGPDRARAAAALARTARAAPGDRAHPQRRHARSAARRRRGGRAGAHPRRARLGHRRPGRQQPAHALAAQVAQAAGSPAGRAFGGHRTLPARARSRAAIARDRTSAMAWTPRASRSPAIAQPRAARRCRRTGPNRPSSSALVGRVAEVKNLPVLLDAFARLRAQRSRLRATRAPRDRRRRSGAGGDAGARVGARTRLRDLVRRRAGRRRRSACRRSTWSACPRWPKASRTRSSRRWRAASRSSPPTSAETADLVVHGSHRRAGAIGRRRRDGASDRDILHGCARLRDARQGRSRARRDRVQPRGDAERVPSSLRRAIASHRLRRRHASDADALSQGR